MTTGTPRHTWTDSVTAITAAKLNETEQDVADALITATQAYTLAAAASPTTYTNEQAQDTAAALFTGGTHSGISFAYDDAGNAINATVTVGGGSSGGGVSSVRSVSANATAVTGELLKVNATGGARTITPPSSPTTGAEVVVVKTDSSTNPVIWSGTVQGDTDGAQITSQWGAATFVWDTSQWIVESTNLATSSATAIDPSAAITTFAADATRTRAYRFSRRAGAEIRAILAESLPGASIATAVTEATSQISGGSWVEMYPSGGPLNPAFRWSGGTVGVAGVTYPDTVCVTATGLDSTFGGLPFTAEFMFDGAQFEVDYKWRVPGDIRVWADDILVGTAVTPTGTPNGNFYKHLVTLPSARARRIRIDFSGSLYVYGLYVPAATSVAYPAGKAKGPRFIVMGDSYTEGTGATTDAQTFVARLSAGMGWVDTWRSGSGGTGYLATPTSPTGRKTLRQRVATDVIAPNPNIVMIAAGINDRSFSAAQVGAEASLLFDQIKTSLPNAEVIIVGPWGPRGNAPQIGIDQAAAIKTQTLSRGWYFVDPIAEQWITGTGYVGATTGEGNSDIYIGADGTHPTDAGHAYLAERLAGHLRTLGMTAS